jgi:GntR family transcriptional regulator
MLARQGRCRCRAHSGHRAGAPITILRRLLKLGDEPVVFDEIYLPSELFPDLSLEVLRSGESLYSLFETRYGVRMIRADESAARRCG